MKPVQRTAVKMGKRHGDRLALATKVNDCKGKAAHDRTPNVMRARVVFEACCAQGVSCDAPEHPLTLSKKLLAKAGFLVFLPKRCFERLGIGFGQNREIHNTLAERDAASIARRRR